MRAQRIRHRRARVRATRLQRQHLLVVAQLQRREAVDAGALRELRDQRGADVGALRPGGRQRRVGFPESPRTEVQGGVQFGPVLGRQGLVVLDEARRVARCRDRAQAAWREVGRVDPRRAHLRLDGRDRRRHRPAQRLGARRLQLVHHGLGATGPHLHPDEGVDHSLARAAPHAGGVDVAGAAQVQHLHHVALAGKVQDLAQLLLAGQAERGVMLQETRDLGFAARAQDRVDVGVELVAREQRVELARRGAADILAGAGRASDGRAQRLHADHRLVDAAVLQRAGADVGAAAGQAQGPVGRQGAAAVKRFAAVRGAVDAAREAGGAEADIADRARGRLGQRLLGLRVGAQRIVAGEGAGPGLLRVGVGLPDLQCLVRVTDAGRDDIERLRQHADAVGGARNGLGGRVGAVEGADYPVDGRSGVIGGPEFVAGGGGRADHRFGLGERGARALLVFLAAAAAAVFVTGRLAGAHARGQAGQCVERAAA